MLTKGDLQELGYQINPDPDQPGMFYWRRDMDGSDISFHSEAEAIESASNDAFSMFDICRCDNCGQLQVRDELNDIKDYSMRVDEGGEAPAGECPECGSLSYIVETGPDWEQVMAFFGLDHSFCWTSAHVDEYLRLYHQAMFEAESDVAKAAKALAFVEEVSGLLKPEGSAFSSDEILTGLINKARDIVGGGIAAPASVRDEEHRVA